MFGANFTELLVLGIIGLLLFGKRLPEVAKNLGKGVSEFKKGLSGFQDELSGNSSRSSSSSSYARNRLPWNWERKSPLLRRRFDTVVG